MPDFIAEGFVSIVPDFTTFDALLQAKITAALAQVQATQAAGATASAASTVTSGAAVQQALPGFAAIQTQATSAAQAVTQQLVPAVNSVAPAMKNANTASSNLQQSLKGLENQFNNFKNLAFVAVIAESIKQFAQFDNAVTTSKAVFGDASQSIIDFAKQQTDALGLSETQIVKSATAIGGALTAMGASGKEAATVSLQLTQRAADLAAAFGTTADNALKAFQLGLEGNSRGLKQFNIDISAADQAREAARLGYVGTVSSLNDLQKAQIANNLILEKSSQFAGDAAKTQATLAGELRGLKADVTNTGVAIGKDLAPAFAFLVEPVRTVLQLFQDLPQPMQAVIVDATVLGVGISLLSTKLITLAGISLPAALDKLATLSGGITGFGSGVSEATSATSGLSGGVGALGQILGGVASVPMAAFIVGLDLIGQHSDKTKGSLSDLSQVTNQDLTDTFQKLADNNNSIKHTFDDLINTINPFGHSVDASTLSIQHQVEALDKVAAGSNGLANAQRVVTQARLDGSDAADALQAELLKLQQADDDRRTSLGQSTIAQEDNTKALQASATALQALFSDTQALAADNDALTAAQNKQKDLQEQLNTLQKEGGKQELIDAQDKLTNATDAHSQAIARQKAAQEALDDLKAPATQRELQDATDGVTLAQIGLNDALRAQKLAQDALNHTNEIHLDLTGKSLAQIRDAIDNARATASANNTVSKNKTPAELQDDLTKANIGVTTATEKLNDSQSTLNDTINKGNIDKLQSQAAIDKITQANYNLAQANNAVLSTQNAQDKAQFELNNKLAGQTTYATQIKTLNKDIASAKQEEQKAQEKITADTAKQKDDLAATLGTVGRISEVLRQNLASNIGLFANNQGLQRAIVEQVVNQVAPGQTLPLVITPKVITELFNDIVSDPSAFFELLKQFGLTVPGHAEGAVITSETFSRTGEGGLAELILPLTKPDRAWELLAQSLPHMTLPLRQKLEPVIRPDLTRNLGNVHTSQIAIPNAMTAEQAQQMIDLLGDIAERTSGDVDLNIYPTAGMNERQLTEKIRQEFVRLMGGR